jgi:sensory rhodopsin
MYITEIDVYWVSAIIFLFSTIVFLLKDRNNIANRFFIVSEVFVSFLTAISYVVMALAIATVISPFGEAIYWSRWLFYMGSCSILALNVALVFDKKDIVNFFKISILTGLVMFCGFLASYVTVGEKWIFFGLSSGAYLGLLYTLFWNSNCDDDPVKRSIMWLVIIFWSLFPVIWVLAPTGFGLISPLIESIGYLLLDVITKIVFGLYLIKKHKNFSLH